MIATVMRVLGRILALLSAGMSCLFFLRVRSPASAQLWVPKVVTSALAAYLTVAAVLGAILGLLIRRPLTLLLGAGAAAVAGRYLRRVAGTQGDLAAAFGVAWEDRIPPDRRAALLAQRWTWRLPPSPQPCWQRDVPFWTVPAGRRDGSAPPARPLLCDLWQPPPRVAPSGLAFIYHHGGLWSLMDKDFGTRPFFRHLAAQGHVVMDVAYRLSPEVAVGEMVGDVKRAVVWMKAHAAQYGVNPDRVVVAGASSGGHLALLAAYTPECLALTPADIGDADMSVRAVVSYYGATDLCAEYAHLVALNGRRQTPAEEPGRTVGRPGAAATGATALTDRIRALLTKSPAQAISPQQVMERLLGGAPDDAPAMYTLASPLTHAGAHCPPTLLFHGEHDFMVPVEAMHALSRRLRAAGVPVVAVELPQTDHAFDIFLPQVSPAMQAALYDLDRFLALIAAGEPEERSRYAEGQHAGVSVR